MTTFNSGDRVYVLSMIMGQVEKQAATIAYESDPGIYAVVTDRSWDHEPILKTVETLEPMNGPDAADKYGSILDEYKRAQSKQRASDSYVAAEAFAAIKSTITPKVGSKVAFLLSEKGITRLATGLVTEFLYPPSGELRCRLVEKNGTEHNMGYQSVKGI